MSVKHHEAYCLDSISKRCDGFDHFWGDSIDARWRGNGTGGSAVVVDAQTGGICRITGGPADNNYYYIDWGDIRSLLVSKKVTMECRVKLETSSNISPILFLTDNLTNYARFWADTDAAHTNWQISIKNTGTSSEDSGIALDTDYHIFRIECFPTGEVHFYIDDVETSNSPLNTVANIPTQYLQPLLFMRTREASNHYIDIDYVWWRQNR